MCRENEIPLTLFEASATDYNPFGREDILRKGQLNLGVAPIWAGYAHA